jgi:hypothetical protein
MASLLKGSAKGRGTKIKVEVEDFITTAETFALTSPDRAGFLVKQVNCRIRTPTPLYPALPRS